LNFLCLLVFELLFFPVEILLGLAQPVEMIFLLPEFLRELITAVLGPVLVESSLSISSSSSRMS
jgi:hypothetical protein